MKKLHLLCNAHIDTVWQWTEDEGLSSVLSTFRSAINLLKEYDYVFCHGEACLYQFVEKTDKALFEEIKAEIKKGRWVIIGGWYLQPDCNLPSGESFVRQITVGKKYFKEKFGVDCPIAFNPDPFGHSKGIVQIAAKCGQTGYMFMRPFNYYTETTVQLKLPDERFIWRGVDGSELKAVRFSSYNSPLGKAVEKIKADIDNQKNYDIGLTLWGVGNHGGGPSAKDLKDIKTFADESDINVIHSSPEEFFKEAEFNAVFDKSLHTSMPGCYTVMSKIKRKHAELEDLLFEVEKLCSVVSAKGYKKYPHEKLNEAQEDLLKVEFHDVLAGTVIRSGEENALDIMRHAIKILTDIRTEFLFALMKNEPYSGNAKYPVAVFNAHPYRLNADIECEFTLVDQNWNENTISIPTVKDGNGNVLPSQKLKEESNINLDWRQKVLFRGELNPLGLTWFSIDTEFGEKREKQTSYVFSDDYKTVEIDERTGLLKLDFGGAGFVDAFLPVLFDDNEDPWGMGMQCFDGFNENRTPFEIAKTNDGVFYNLSHVRVTENGDLALNVEADFQYGNNKVVNTYKIYKNSPYVDVEVRVFWQDCNKMLKLELPVLGGGEFVGQIAFGTEKLFSDGRECISQRFCGMEKDGKFLGVFKKGCYGCSFKNGSLYISLIKGATYCAHPAGGRPIVEYDRFLSKIDIGEHSFKFRLCLCDMNETERIAEEFCQKPYAINAYFSGKNAYDNKDLLRIENENIVLKAFKSNEKSQYVIRLFNDSDKREKTRVFFDGTEKELSFEKYEVKTLVVCERNIIEQSEIED